jgi:hypothetical protein
VLWSLNDDQRGQVTAVSKAIQHDVITCQGGGFDCGAQAIVTPTKSPFEFEVHCPTCDLRSVRSWAHSNPAPKFVPLRGTEENTAEGAGPRADNLKGKAAMKTTREQLLRKRGADGRNDQPRFDL